MQSPRAAIIRAHAKQHPSFSLISHTHKHTSCMCVPASPADTLFGADLTIMEEGTELLQRLKEHLQEVGGSFALHHAGFLHSGGPTQHPQHPGCAWIMLPKLVAAASLMGVCLSGCDILKHAHISLTHFCLLLYWHVGLLLPQDPNKERPLPMFTSCCPGWVAMVEKSSPELIPYLSSCKSPQMMLGAVLKNYFANETGLAPGDMCNVSIMPCVRKQGEADREWFNTSGGAVSVLKDAAAHSFVTLLTAAAAKPDTCAAVLKQRISALRHPQARRGRSP